MLSATSNRKMQNISEKSAPFFEHLSISKKKLAVLFLIVFVLSLIPIVMTMFYTVPVLDDYNFGLGAHKSYSEGNGFWSGVLKSCDFFYSNWQGFYTSNFIASSQLYTIDESLYFISNLVFFGVLVFSLFYFAKATLIDVLGLSKIDYVLVSVPAIAFFIQFIPRASEGIYWMDGSLAMLINSISILIISFIIKYDRSGKKPSRILFYIFALVLTLSISGSSLLTYVTMLMLFVFSFVYLINKRSKTLWPVITVFAVYTVGITIALTAPGNAVRLNSMSGFSFFKSIAYAILYSIIYFGRWATISFIAVLLFISVVLWNSLKTSKFSFKNPLLVFLICYVVYAGRMSVQFYAGGRFGSGRQLNQYFLGFLICMSIAWIYFIGWLSKRKPLKTIKQSAKSINLIFCIILCLLFIAGGFDYGKRMPTSVSTSLSFVRGQTQQYNKEMKERLALYHNDSIKDVEIKPVSYLPDFFAGDEISEDPEYWVNDAIAEYYNKESVKLKNNQN